MREPRAGRPSVLRLTEAVTLVGSGGIGLSHRLDCHVYLVETGNGMALVDAGCGANAAGILENLRIGGFDLKHVRWLLLTHAHLDHAGGAAFLREQLGLQVIASAPEADLIERGTDDELGLTLARFQGGYPDDIVYHHVIVDRRVEHDSVLELGRMEVRAIEVAGHSAGSLCFLLVDGGRRVLFTGDTLFFNGVIGLVNAPGADLAEFRRCMPRLSDLAIDALLPGHGLFVLDGGQAHIDFGLAALRQSMVPPHISLLQV